MKRAVSIIVILMLLVTSVACGSGNTEPLESSTPAGTTGESALLTADSTTTTADSTSAESTTASVQSSTLARTVAATTRGTATTVRNGTTTTHNGSTAAATTRRAATTTSRTTQRRTAVATTAATTTKRSEEMRMIVKTADGKQIVYKLNNSNAARSLYEQLPLTIAASDFSDNEKIFYPPTKLDVSDTPTAEGGAGTLAYYAPWGDVVLFYGDFHSSSSLYELGDIVTGAEHISSIRGNITITAD